jgi:outer membrane lipopolysaccharide assembly protein LptE/RlpB
VPTEYEVFYIVNYSLESGQTTLMPPQTQTQTRIYTWDETLVLGKQHEQQTLRDAIVGDLVRVVMIQLSAI